MTHLRTRAVHAGQQPDPHSGAITTPITQSTAFNYGRLAQGAALFAGTAEGYRYSRFGNPTVAALEAKVADLEGAPAAVAFASGTAATSAVLLGLLHPGDEIAYLGPLYGGTESLFNALGERFGLRAIDATQRGLAASLTPTTRLVWVEALTNPGLALHDLAEVAALARARGITTVADNTFCTPCLLRPLELGIDLVLHSMTKYFGGHGDATGGVVAGAAPLVAAVRKTGLAHVGGNPQHALAQRQLQGGFGGMVTFVLQRDERASAAAVLDALQLFTQAVSLGDVDSLACHPASTTHSALSAELRAAHGVSEGLIRLSVGIEHPDDLIADLAQALQHAV